MFYCEDFIGFLSKILIESTTAALCLHQRLSETISGDKNRTKGPAGDTARKNVVQNKQ